TQFLPETGAVGFKRSLCENSSAFPYIVRPRLGQCSSRAELDGMAYIAGTDRTQAVLLPDVLDDYVGADNPVRFLDAFVAHLDLDALGFQRAVPAETGRPGYDPGDLLRLYLCGYLHRIRSSRRFEQETHRNVELMWLLRRRTPDLNTIADFRRDHPAAGHRRPSRHKA